MNRQLLNLICMFTAMIIFSHCTKTNEKSINGGPQNNDSVQFLFPPNTIYTRLNQIAFTSIVIDNADAKWMINSQNIFQYKDSVWRIYNSVNMPVDLSLYENNGLFCDSKGRIFSYLRSYSGEGLTQPLLIVFDNYQWKSYPFPLQVKVMTVDKWTDRMYFVNFGDTIYQYNGSGNFSDLASYTQLDLGGQYYIANLNAAHDSLLVFFNQSLASYKTDSGHSGLLIGNGQGNIRQINFPDSMPNINLSGVFGPDGKTVYMVLGLLTSYGYTGTDTLCMFDGSAWNIIPMGLNTGYDWMNSLKFSNDGVLWISYGWSMMIEYKNQQFHTHDLSNNIPYSHINGFAFDSHNVKWLACSEGLVRYNVQ